MGLRQVIHRHIVQQVAGSIAWAYAIFAVGIGVSLTIARPEVVRLPTFEVNFTFAPPHVWGIGFIVLAVWLGVALTRNTQAAALPLYGLAIITCTWGAFTLPSITHGGGAVTAPWAYSLIAVVAGLIGFSLGEQE